jgi:hypothetical protein
MCLYKMARRELSNEWSIINIAWIFIQIQPKQIPQILLDHPVQFMRRYLEHSNQGKYTEAVVGKVLESARKPHIPP